MVYPPGEIVLLWVTVSRFLAGNREADLKFLLFRDFLSLLFSWPPSDIVPLSADCWVYSLIIIIIIIIIKFPYKKLCGRREPSD